MDYARDLRTGKIVAAEDASRGRFYACPRPGCGGRVYLPRVTIQRAHFRHVPGEGTRACDQYFPGIGGGEVRPVIDVAVEEDPAELGLVLAELDGRWGLGLRVPEIPSDELGETPLSALRSATLDLYAGSVLVRRVSALDLRPGVGTTSVDVVPSLQVFRSEPAGTWPSTIDQTRWFLESRAVDAKGTLFRFRRGEWTRLRASSGVHHGETLLVLADARCALPPAAIVTKIHAEISSGGLKWIIREVRLPEDGSASVTAWIGRLGHEIVPRPWTLQLATPSRARGELGEAVFWIGDSPVLALDAPLPGAEGLLSIKTGSNSNYATVRASGARVAHVCISSPFAGPTRLAMVAEQSASIDLTFVEQPSHSSIFEVLAQTPRLRVWIGEQPMEAWQGSTHKVRVGPRELPNVRVDLGAKSARVRITVWERGKQRSRGDLNARGAEKAIQEALSTASRIEVDADNLGRVELIPIRIAAVTRREDLGGGRLAWRDYAASLSPQLGEPTKLTLVEQPRADTSLVGRRIGAASLIRARLALRRRRERTGGGQ